MTVQEMLDEERRKADAARNAQYSKYSVSAMLEIERSKIPDTPIKNYVAPAATTIPKTQIQTPVVTKKDYFKDSQVNAEANKTPTTSKAWTGMSIKDNIIPQAKDFTPAKLVEPEKDKGMNWVKDISKSFLEYAFGSTLKKAAGNEETKKVGDAAQAKALKTATTATEQATGSAEQKIKSMLTDIRFGGATVTMRTEDFDNITKAVDIVVKGYNDQIIKDIPDNALGRLSLAPVSGALEGVAGVYQGVGAVSDLGNLITKGVTGNKNNSFSSSTLIGNMTQGMTKEAYQEVRSNAGKVEGYASDLLNSAGRMLPGILAGGAGGAIAGNVTSALNYGGSSFAQDVKDGKTYEQALIHGTFTGIAEAYLQYYLGRLPGLSKVKGEGFVDKLFAKQLSSLDNVIKTSVKSPVLQKLFKTAIVTTTGGLSEATEETLQQVMGNAYQKFIYKEKTPMNEGLWQSAWMGFAMSALLGVGGNISQGVSFNEKAKVENTAEMLKNFAEEQVAQIEPVKLTEQQYNGIVADFQQQMAESTDEIFKANMQQALDEFNAMYIPAEISTKTPQIGDNALGVQVDAQQANNSATQATTAETDAKMQSDKMFDDMLKQSTKDRWIIMSDDVMPGYNPNENGIYEVYATDLEQAKSNFKEQYGTSKVRLVMPMYDYRINQDILQKQKEQSVTAQAENSTETAQGVQDTETQPIAQPQTTDNIFDLGLTQNTQDEPAAVTDFTVEEGSLIKMAKAKFNREVVITENLPGNAEGMYDKGKIYVGRNADNVYYVFGHELTHSLEVGKDNQQAYNRLSRYVADTVIGRKNMQAEIETTKQHYAEIKPDMTDGEAYTEVIAKATGKYLFTDADAIAKIVRTDRSLASKIVQFLRETATRLAGTKEQKAVLKAIDLYRAALKQANTTENGKTQFATARIKKDTSEQTKEGTIGTLTIKNKGKSTNIRVEIVDRQFYAPILYGEKYNYYKAKVLSIEGYPNTPTSNEGKIRPASGYVFDNVVETRRIGDILIAKDEEFTDNFVPDETKTTTKYAIPEDKAPKQANTTENGKTQYAIPKKTIYTGSTNTNITRFVAGGDGLTRTSGDSYGKGIYLTDSKDIATSFAKGNGKVYDVTSENDLLDLDSPIDDKFKQTILKELDTASKQYLNKFRSVLSQKTKTFDNRDKAYNFFKEQQSAWNKNDGVYERNKPDTSVKNGVYEISYIDFDTDIAKQIDKATNKDIFEAIRAISTEAASGVVISAGYDGIMYNSDGDNIYVVYKNLDKLKINNPSTAKYSIPEDKAPKLPMKSTKRASRTAEGGLNADEIAKNAEKKAAAEEAKKKKAEYKKARTERLANRTSSEVYVDDMLSATDYESYERAEKKAEYLKSFNKIKDFLLMDLASDNLVDGEFNEDALRVAKKLATEYSQHFEVKRDIDAVADVIDGVGGITWNVTDADYATIKRAFGTNIKPIVDQLRRIITYRRNSDVGSPTDEVVEMIISQNSAAFGGENRPGTVTADEVVQYLLGYSEDLGSQTSQFYNPVKEGEFDEKGFIKFEAERIYRDALKQMQDEERAKTEAKKAAEATGKKSPEEVQAIVDKGIEKSGYKEPVTQEQLDNKQLIPNKITKDGKSVTVRGVFNTSLHMGLKNKETYPDIIDKTVNGNGTYTPESNKKTLDAAQKKIDRLGYDGALSEWEYKVVNDMRIRDIDVATAELLYKAAIEGGQGDIARKLLSEIAMIGTENGQAIQIISLFNKLNGEAHLITAQKIADRLNKQTEEQRKKQEKAPIEIPDNLAEKVRKAKTPAEKDAAFMEIKQDMYDQLPYGTWWERWNAWRYISMLGNFKTNIKNVGGNMGMLPLVAAKNLQLISMEKVANDKRLAQLKNIQAQMSKVKTKEELVELLGKANREDTGYVERLTQQLKDAGQLFEASILKTEMLNLNKRIEDGIGIYRTRAFHKSKAAHDFAVEDFKARAKSVMSGSSKYMGIPNSEFNDRRIFKFGLFEGARKLTNKPLEYGDKVFINRYYVNALASFLDANNVDIDAAKQAGEAIAKGETPADENAAKMVNLAREYATQEAREATFRDFSLITETIVEFRDAKTVATKHGTERTLKQSERIARRIAVDSVLPFIGTLVNITRRGAWEYNVGGLAKTILFDTNKVKTGEMSATTYLNNIAKGTTGSAVVLMGYLLGAAGLIVGRLPEDENEKDLAKTAGQQAYSLILGDHSYTIDWIAPFCIPLFLGVELSNLKKSGATQFKDYYQAGMNILSPLFELTLLKSVTDVVKAVKYENEPAQMFGVGASTLGLNYLAQGTPTLFGQISRTITKEQKTSVVDEGNPFTRDQQFFVQKIMGKLFMNQNKQDYVNMFGETKDTGNVAQRIATNFFLPWYSSKLKDDATIKGMISLEKEKTDGLGVNTIPKIPSASLPGVGEYENKTFQLTADQLTELKKQVGIAQKLAADAFITSKNEVTLRTQYITGTSKDGYKNSLVSFTSVKNNSKGMYSDEDLKVKAIDKAMNKAYNDAVIEFIKAHNDLTLKK